MITLEGYIADFMDIVSENPRMGPKHVSLMLAILYYFHHQGGSNPVTVFSAQLRDQAKIKSERIYYYVMRDLKDWGYIKLAPSFKPGVASLITLREIGSKE
ncbi:hypothetical protein [Chitinophaga hostae]|uniref:Helix-turn-helix domain-containing protein n=1 Tax=Chitinophaga hostae TaxID=2831022 RepID=A0ABS5IVT8_9BACT|nr:hypothetical protein [Chitinophaga hostae]MBS0027065.1 hypothetical protein [Chitinophaga hostae]